jgi:hypothetical protein
MKSHASSNDPYLHTTGISSTVTSVKPALVTTERIRSGSDSENIPPGPKGSPPG